MKDMQSGIIAPVSWHGKLLLIAELLKDDIHMHTVSIQVVTFNSDTCHNGYNYTFVLTMDTMQAIFLLHLTA